ncbi:GNAT family N-acetyltransferase [Exiguobacterium sp. s36]|uniref:GNAT family N-acetyltransferase n=1 Tax=Exiguobacterium sp. s36 TaxID=2751227 RepID=UPI001BEAF9A6|nr:GNAT family N-acetyltransferase [Exiguobacterium sp. s36]
MWRGDCNGLDIVVNYLTVAELDQIEAVQRSVMDALTEGSQYQSLTTEEFMKLLSDRTLIGAYHEGTLIAFRALLIPPLDAEHLGYDIGYPLETIDRVLYQEVTNVHPDYRGYGLQQHLGKLLMKELEQDSRFDLVCATVAPFNIPSLKDKFALGLRIGALKPKYGGKLRYIFMKELHSDWKPAGEATWLNMGETEQQVALLKTGWFGTTMTRDGERWLVKYER